MAIILDELIAALQRLLDDITDAGEDRNPDTGDEFDSVTAARAALARAKGLPPDPEGKNDDRARWAGQAIKAFQDATATDDEDVLSDLLGDLMHWADRNNYDFQAAIDKGRWHYDAETGGEK